MTIQTNARSGRAAVTVIMAGQARPNTDEPAKLPYRRPVVAIPGAVVARAMARGLEAAERVPGFRPGAPIVGQAAEVEEAYWRTVWHRLGRPDPGLID